MKLLILGGTRFVGRHITETALARGHQVTLFNRGQSNTDLFPNTEKLSGDRNASDLASIKARIDAGATWDAVIDVNGYVPRVVREVAELVAKAVKQYAFISTISVFEDIRSADENAALKTLQDETTEQITGETYGGLKVLCERVVEEIFPNSALIVRPGLIVGPDDHTERFNYYLARALRGGEMLAPGSGNDPIQFIDARDLANFTLDMVEKGATGIYNATGPDYKLTMRKLYDTVQQAAANDLSVTWVDAPFLSEQGVQMWTNLPLWVDSESEDGGIHTANVSKAIAAGLKFRPLEDTVHDTLAWEKSRNATELSRAGFGITLEREAELLKAWHERNAG